MGELFGDEIADATQFFVTKRIGGFLFENHFAAFEHSTFGDQNSRIVAGIAFAVGAKQLGEPFDIEFVFGDDAAIGGACHGGKHGGKAGVAAEHFENHESFMGTSGSTQTVGELNGSRDASAEADAVIGTRDVVVHGFGNADNLEAFLIKTHGVTEGVIATDGDEVFDAQPVEIFQNFGREVLSVRGGCAFEVFRETGFADAAGVGARRMEKRAAGTAGAVDDFFGEELVAVRIVVILVANHVHESGPAAANADDLVTFAKSAEGNGTDGRVETGNVAASRENADNAFLGPDVGHESIDRPSCDREQEIIPLAARFRKSRRRIHFFEGMDAKILVWRSELDFCAEKKKEGRTRTPPLRD